MTPALLAVRTERIANGIRPVAERLELEVEDAQRMYLAAAAVRNMPLALKAKGLKRSLLELLAKISGELDERPHVAINIQQTQVWIENRTVVLEELEPYPEVRQRIVSRLRVLEGQAE